MSLLDRFRPQPATDFQLEDGSGVFLDPGRGPVAGRVVQTATGPFVAPHGRYTRDTEGYDDFQTQPAPAGWQDRITRRWRG